MPRRLIIGILVVLILGIVGGTGVLIVQRLRGSSTQTPDANDPGTLQPADSGSQPLANPEGDDDGDGLSNALEVTWSTDPANADTDGDGYKDGEEIAASHNPTIPSPNDKLPENFVPGQNLQPLAGALDAPLAVDQFFVDEVDLTGGNKNYTEEYRQQFPEADRTPDTLATFAESQPIITNLPRPAAKATQAQANDTPLVMGEYLEIAGNLGVFSNRSAISEAINDTFGESDTSLMSGLALSMRLHQKNLIAQRVPASAVPLHQLLLGYTEVLAATYDQMAQYNTDPVKAVVGLHQQEQLDKKYYPLIEQEVDRLTRQHRALQAAAN